MQSVPTARDLEIRTLVLAGFEALLCLRRIPRLQKGAGPRTAASLHNSKCGYLKRGGKARDFVLAI